MQSSSTIQSSEINGATVLCAVFGDPVEHSRSPVMHNAAYSALKMNRKYVAFRVTKKNLAAALRAIPAMNIAGVNLTVPHKEQAGRLIKDLSDEARILGAVNCVVNRGGKLVGDNTDARGLERDLRAQGYKPAGGLAIVVGAGGGAAAAILACHRIGASHIVVANRTTANARALARRLQPRLGRATRLEACGLDSIANAERLAGAEIIVNATPMGLTTTRFARLDYAATPVRCLFYDLIYKAEPTAFLKPALASGRRGADGAGMLVNQGELAFKLFNRVAPPPGVMRTALFQSLGRSAT